MIQPLDEIERWHKIKDPWKYENSQDDQLRKHLLLSELPSKNYSRVLDIGCGQGFITRDLPGDSIIGVDVSSEAIKHAKKYEDERISFMQCSIFELNNKLHDKFDLIIITGVLYPQYIGDSLNLVYIIIDNLLKENGIIISVHINSWYKAKFPYLLLTDYYYDYRDFTHKLEVYAK